MKPTCKVEIIIDKVRVRAVLEVFETHGLSGWTRLRVEAGAGKRGERRDDDPGGATASRLLITTCRPEKLDALVDDLRPIMKRYGGACIVSEAQWVAY